ncbi:hypothetical protein [Dongia sp. agr-C8]
MVCNLRPRNAAALAAGLLIGLCLASSTALAEARQVGGTRATWDKACQKNKDCMPVGDLGGGVNGYFVHDGKGGGTSVWCDDNNCVADRRPIKPRKDAVQLLQQPALPMGGANGGKPATGSESPAMLLEMR